MITQAASIARRATRTLINGSICEFATCALSKLRPISTALNSFQTMATPMTFYTGSQSVHFTRQWENYSSKIVKNYLINYFRWPLAPPSGISLGIIPDDFTRSPFNAYNFFYCSLFSLCCHTGSFVHRCPIYRTLCVKGLMETQPWGMT